jgi:hypothetical protein
MPQEPDPLPPAPIVLAGLLRLIASGLEQIETRDWRPGASVGVMTGSGWWLVIRGDDEGQPVELLHAQPPSLLVPAWIYGGQRDDWTLGPESQVVTPVELLSDAQRDQLRRRLETAPAPWQFRPLPVWDVDWSGSDDDEVILD